MSKHTPGPWRANAKPMGNPYGVITEHGENENWSICNDGGRFIAAIKMQPEEEANARLIAAAPEMLEALESALNVEGAARAGSQFIPAYEGLDTGYHFEKVRAAIRKAKGE